MAEQRKTEDEWFARNERELLKGLKRERERKEKEIAELFKQEDARKRRELHWMKCPKDGSDLTQETISGIKIEKCPLCEGIFLDRGELEELLLKQHEERRTFMRRLTGLFSS